MHKCRAGGLNVCHVCRIEITCTIDLPGLIGFCLSMSLVNYGPSNVYNSYIHAQFISTPMTVLA